MSEITVKPVDAFWNGFGYRILLQSGGVAPKVYRYVSQDGYRWVKVYEDGSQVCVNRIYLRVTFIGGPRKGETDDF